VEVEVRAEVRDTEDLRKVKKAILNLFSPDSVEVEDLGDRRLIVARGRGASSLRKLYNALRSQRILDAARSYLRMGCAGNTVVFHLHKQAAYVGVASFCSLPERESPLGPITFIVTTSDTKRFIDWLAPRTVRGQPVGEAKPPDP